jgi:hypothetical protein
MSAAGCHGWLAEEIRQIVPLAAFARFAPRKRTDWVNSLFHPTIKFLKIARLTFFVLPLAAFVSSLAASSFDSADIGNPKLKGSITQTNGGVEMIAGGRDVWGVSDEFHFAYQKCTGDFDVAVRVEHLAPAQLYSRAGIMARESLAPASRHVFFIVFSDNKPRHNNNAGYELQFRDMEGGHSKAIYPPANGQRPSPFLVSYPRTWLRLRRRGNEFTAFASNDGTQWNTYGTQSIPLSASLYLGLALTAHDGNATASASFRDFVDLH